MTREAHNLKKVVSGATEVIKCTVAKIVKNKVGDTGILEGRFPGAFKFIKWFSIKEKHTVGMQSPGRSFTVLIPPSCSPYSPPACEKRKFAT